MDAGLILGSVIVYLAGFISGAVTEVIQHSRELDWYQSQLGFMQNKWIEVNKSVIRLEKALGINRKLNDNLHPTFKLREPIMRLEDQPEDLKIESMRVTLENRKQWNKLSKEMKENPNAWLGITKGLREETLKKKKNER